MAAHALFLEVEHGLLAAGPSLVVEHGFEVQGFGTAAYGLRSRGSRAPSCDARAQLARGMWNRRSRDRNMSPHWQVES